MLLARGPRTSLGKTLWRASMTLQMIEAMNFLYRELSPQESAPYIREFKILLQQYLECWVEHRMK